MKSVTHNTCALNGNHPPGSKYAAECPLRPGRGLVRSEAMKQRWARKKAQEGGDLHPAHTTALKPENPTLQPVENTVVLRGVNPSRRPFEGVKPRGGRPRRK